MKILFLLPMLALAGCADTSGYYSSDPTDTIAARVAEGAIFCHVPARGQWPAFDVTTNTRQACRSVGGIPRN